MTMPARTWGARFFPVQDSLAILGAAGLTVMLYQALHQQDRWLVPMPALALGHFFLFCNLFRVRRSYELLWSAAFLANAIGWKLAGVYSCWLILAVQTPFTLLAIVAEVRSPEYHGLCADRWNQHLPRWLAGG